MVFQTYGQSTPLFYGQYRIDSQTGVQQEDPLGSLSFALAIDPIIQAINTSINVWYLDDGTLAGPPQQIINSITTLTPKLAEIGLVLKPSKCEVMSLSSESSNAGAAVQKLQTLLPAIQVLNRNQLMLLNSPILDEALPAASLKAKEQIDNICQRIACLDAHTALFFLSHYTSAPRLTYLMRSSPMYLDKGNLHQIDETVRTTAVASTNVEMEGSAWKQAALPVRHGRLGFRTLSNLALPCYISLHKTNDLVQQLIPPLMQKIQTPLLSAKATQNIKYPNAQT